MKMKLALCSIAFSFAAFAASSSHTVTLANSVWAGATELKPGDYKVVMSGDKAVFTKGKQVVEVPATLAPAEKKFSSTTLISKDSKLEEIDLGGTASKIVFEAAPVANGTK